MCVLLRYLYITIQTLRQKGEVINITCKYIAVVWNKKRFFNIKPRHASLVIATVCKELKSKTAMDFFVMLKCYSRIFKDKSCFQSINNSYFYKTSYTSSYFILLYFNEDIGYKYYVYLQPHNLFKFCTINSNLIAMHFIAMVSSSASADGAQIIVKFNYLLSPC